MLFSFQCALSVGFRSISINHRFMEKQDFYYKQSGFGLYRSTQPTGILFAFLTIKLMLIIKNLN